MRRVIVSTYVTLDGKVDDIREWALPPNDDEAVKYHTDLLAKSDALVLGRKTYEIFAAVWPSMSGKFAYIDKMNSMAKHVASTQLGELTWENSHRIEGDFAEGVAKLKQRAGQDLVVYGGHDLTQSLMKHDLVDEYRMLVHPLLLGKGRSFLDDGAKRVNLRLVESTVNPSGVAIFQYEPRR